MAKQNGTMPKIDEDFMRELISQGVPGKPDGGKPDDTPQEAQAEKPTPRKQLSETKQTASPKKAAARSKQHEMEV